MKILGLLLAIIPAMIVAALFSVPANAQATRAWVSGVGDDANPCSRTAPCKTFAGAISKTATGGEINVLDPGGFGALTITKSIQIRSEFEAGVLVSGTNGIVVSVGATDKVLLEGLDIEGLGTGLDGVKMIGGGKLIVRKCSIRNFTGNGVNVVGTANARAFVEDSLIAGNGGGMNVHGAGGAVNIGLLERSLVDNNTTFAVQVDGASALALSGSTLTGSPSSIITTNGGTVISYGNNLLRGAGAPTQTLPLK
jgi:Right handed beta helix region